MGFWKKLQCISEHSNDFCLLWDTHLTVHMEIDQHAATSSTSQYIQTNIFDDLPCWGCVRGLHPRLQHCTEKVQGLPGSLWANSRLSCTSPTCPASNKDHILRWSCLQWKTTFPAEDFVAHLWCAIIEADLVPNIPTQSACHLMGYPLGHCDGSHPAWLGDANFAIFTKTYQRKRQNRSYSESMGRITQNEAVG